MCACPEHWQEDAPQKGNLDLWCTENSRIERKAEKKSQKRDDEEEKDALAVDRNSSK